MTRWSRVAARERWAPVAGMLRVPLPVALLLAAVWPAIGLAVHWTDYHHPAVAAGVLVAAVALCLTLCRLGPRGIGPLASFVGCAGSLGLTWLLGAQLDRPVPDGAFWMNAWAVAPAVVLAFARPPEEPIALGLGSLLVNTAVMVTAGEDIQVLHVAPMAVGAPVSATVSAVALAAALRTSMATARSVRESTEAAQQRLAVADAVARERALRFARWEAAIVPLLDDLAEGRRRPDDPALALECARIARGLRAQLAAAPESLLESLLGPAAGRMQGRGGDLVVRDLDVGYRLREDDRVRLTERIRAVCDADGVGTVQVMLDAGIGDRATVVIAADGLPVPDTRHWGGQLTVENPLLWWWDADLELDPAPALGVDGQPRGR